MRICTVGSNLSSSNVGDVAMFEGLRDLVSERWPDADFTTFAAKPEAVEANLGIKGLSPRKHPFGILRALIRCDVLLITGGTPFYDDVARMIYLLLLASAARLMRKRIIVYAISTRALGYWSVLLVRMILRQVDIVGGREPRAQAVLAALTTPPDKVRFIPDSALGMRAAPAAEVDAWFANHGLDPAVPTLVICPRSLASGSGHQDFYSQVYTNKQLQTLHQVLARLIVHAGSEYGLRCLILCCNTSAPDDDRVAAREIETQARRLDADIDLRMIDEKLTPRMMKGILGRVQAVVTIRFHPMVLALSSGTPAITLGYHQKSQGLLDVFGVGQFGLKAGISDDRELLSRFDELLAQRQTLSRHLVERQAELLTELRGVVASLSQ